MARIEKDPTVEDLLKDAAARIKASPEVDLWRPYVARLDAEELMQIVLDRPVKKKDGDTVLGRKQRERYETLLARRVDGEPILNIRGSMEFCGLTIRVRKGVFGPRNSSESLATEAIKRLKKRTAPVAVDVATGAGPVALAIAAAIPKAKVWGVDIAPIAIKVARDNAKLNKLTNARFRESDMLQDLPAKLRGKVDAFTLHPPYVSRSLVKTLAREIRDFEPPESLTDNSVDGLGLVRKLGAEAADWLRPDGWALVEVSPDLARGVRTILSRAGFKELQSLRDELGATRVIVGHL